MKKVRCVVLFSKSRINILVMTFNWTAIYPILLITLLIALMMRTLFPYKSPIDSATDKLFKNLLLLYRAKPKKPWDRFNIIITFCINFSSGMKKIQKFTCITKKS